MWFIKRFVAVGDSGIFLTSTNGINWEIRKTGTVRNLNSVFYSDSLGSYVAVGDSGAIVTSPDGIDWAPQNAMTSLNLNAVCWSKRDYDTKLFIAVGDSGIILTSQNGVEWRKDSSGVTANLNGFTGRYILGDSCIILTANLSGKGWTNSHKLLSGFRCFSDLYDGADKVAVGNLSFYKYETPNGWTSVSPCRRDNYHAVVRLNDPIGYMAVGDSGFIVSKDGTKWVPGGGTITRDILRSVTWTGSLLVATGDSKTIIYSSDGVEWNIVKDNTFPVENVTWAGGKIVGTGQTFSSTRFFDNNYGNWYTELRSTPSLYFSTDAIKWTQVNIGPTTIYCSECMEPNPMPDNIFVPSSVIWTGEKYVVVGSNGGTVTSADGATWSNVVYAGSNSFNSVTWTGNRCVAVGDSGAIYSSPDGVIWNQQVSGIIEELRSVVWSGKKCVAVGDSGTICTSFDGVTWSRQESGVKSNLGSVVWSGYRFVAVGSQCVTLSSPDGETWVKWVGQSFENKSLTSITRAQDKFVAVGSAGLIFTSPEDPLFIADSYHPPESFNTRLRAYYGSKFLTVAIDGFPSGKPVELRIYTVQGRCVYFSSLQAPLISIPLKAVPGMYIVKATAGLISATTGFIRPEK